MMTVKEAAAELKMSTRFVYRLCGKGVLEHFKLGGRIRIAADAIQRYMDGQRSGAKPQDTVAPRRTQLKLSCIRLKP